MYYDPSGYKATVKGTCPPPNQAKYNEQELPKDNVDGVSRKEALGEIKQDLGISNAQQPDSQKMVMLRDEYGNPIVKDGNIVYSRELTYSVSGRTDGQGNPIEHVIIQDHSEGHSYSNGVGNQTSHFNVRPETNTNTGSVSGMKDHYYFDYRNKK
ncbi:hypothetical protein IMSAGC005_03988 [Lachnospiraceae bacterium]|nr:hypothetical protein IMSAGC005_03988 [Lachnospiraceae bacterium]